MRITHCLTRALTVAAGRVAAIDDRYVRTWSEVHDRVGRIANGLRSLGLREGDRVAVLAHNCLNYLELYYAIPWAGCIIVPLNTRLAYSELEFLIADSEARVLFFGIEFADVALKMLGSGLVESIHCLDDPGSSPEQTVDQLVARFEPVADAGGRSSDLAAIFYTGGTTGTPKGVMLSHANLHTMATTLLMHIPFNEGDVNFHGAPMFHLADIGILFATLAGGTHVIRRSWDAAAIVDAIARHGVTHCFTVPAIVEKLARFANIAEQDMRSLRYLGYGGSSIPAAVMDLARSRFPNVEFAQGFGQTEFPAATFLGPRDHRVEPEDERLRSCGKVCYGYEIRIVDEEGQEVPRRTIGEIVGRGNNVMMGYWNRPDETSEVLRDGWIHTRDAGYMDELGFVYVTDRLKDMIVTGAENVYSIEIENVLSWHPAIDEIAVIGVPDERWGERVHAVVVPGPAATSLDLDELVEFCRDKIAGYKIPKSLTLRRTPLPRNAAGKVLKADLRSQWAAASVANGNRPVSTDVIG